MRASVCFRLFSQGFSGCHGSAKALCENLLLRLVTKPNDQVGMSIGTRIVNVPCRKLNRNRKQARSFSSLLFVKTLVPYAHLCGSVLTISDNSGERISAGKRNNKSMHGLHKSRFSV